MVPSKQPTQKTTWNKKSSSPGATYTYSKSPADPKSAEELRALCTTILERETEDLDAENDRKNSEQQEQQKSTWIKKATRFVKGELLDF